MFIRVVTQSGAIYSLFFDGKTTRFVRVVGPTLLRTAYSGKTDAGSGSFAGPPTLKVGKRMSLGTGRDAITSTPVVEIETYA